MTRMYTIREPEQLVELEKFAKGVGSTSSLANLAKVWNAEKRKGKKTPWEDAIFLIFESKGRGRRAQVYRMKTREEKRVMADMKYSPALEWAREHLEEVEAAL